MVGSTVGAVAGYVAGDKQETGFDAAGEYAGAATGQAVAESSRQFDLIRGDFAPYKRIGVNALRELASMYGISDRKTIGDDGERLAGGGGSDIMEGGGFDDGLLSAEDMQEARERFRATPGYDFRFGEGIRALDRSAAARGRLGEGGHSRDLMRFGQGIASDEFNNYANRLAGLAGVGQTATQSTAAAGMAHAGTAANAYMTGGLAQANYAGLEGTARASKYASFGQNVNQGWQNESNRGAYLFGQFIGGGGMGMFAGGA